MGDDALGALLSRSVRERAVLSDPLLQRGVSKSKRVTKAKAANDKRRRDVQHRTAPVYVSKLRFFRRLQSAYGGKRNIGMVKLVNTTGGKRKVVYVIARSLGLGVSKLTLGSEEILTGGNTLKKRSHSEALMRAALDAGKLDVGGRILNIGPYVPEYGASTNSACGHEHENCAVESVPLLNAPVFYSANPYGGSGDASGWEKLNNAHQRDVKQARKKAKKSKKSEYEYESDPESEDEYEAVVIDDEALRGTDAGETPGAAVKVIPFARYRDLGPADKKSRDKGNYGAHMKRDLVS